MKTILEPTQSGYYRFTCANPACSAVLEAEASELRNTTNEYGALSVSAQCPHCWHYSHVDTVDHMEYWAGKTFASAMVGAWWYEVRQNAPSAWALAALARLKATHPELCSTTPLWRELDSSEDAVRPSKG